MDDDEKELPEPDVPVGPMAKVEEEYWNRLIVQRMLMRVGASGIDIKIVQHLDNT